jgi:hypothetical protein
MEAQRIWNNGLAFGWGQCASGAPEHRVWNSVSDEPKNPSKRGSSLFRGEQWPELSQFRYDLHV